MVKLPPVFSFLFVLRFTKLIMHVSIKRKLIQAEKMTHAISQDVLWLLIVMTLNKLLVAEYLILCKKEENKISGR